jgi:hypothetical protein
MSSAHLLKASEKVQKYKFNLHYQAFGRCIFPEGASPLQACWTYVNEAVGGDMSLLVSRKLAWGDPCSEGSETTNI